MKKINFLTILRQTLNQTLTEDEVNLIIEYYESYFNEEVELGKVESQILSELGDPLLLAAIILNQHQNMGTNENIDLASITSYEGSTLFKTTDTFEVIRISCINATINLIYDTGATGEIIFTVKDDESLDKNDYSLEAKNHQLSFSEHYTPKRVLSPSRRYKPYVINCYIPLTAINTKLRLHTINGRINILGKSHDLTSKVDISSINGSLYISDISAPLLTFTTVNGTLNIKQGLFNAIEIKTVNSHSFINFKASKLGAKLKCKAVNCGVSVNGYNIMQGSINGASNLVLFHGSSDEFMELNLITINGSLTISH